MGRLFLRESTLPTFLHLVAGVLIAVYMWPFWSKGLDAHLLVHDQLDSLFISFKILAESGLLFAHPDTQMSAIGNGVTRLAYPSPFFGVVWLFMLLDPYWGWVVAQLILRIVAYWGMYLLLSRHFLKAREHRLIASFSALAFSLLPHYVVFGLSIAGQPLFFSSLLSIRDSKGRLFNWIVCILFPMWSFSALGGFFAIAVGWLFWCTDVLLRRKDSQPLLYALILTTVTALIVDYQHLMPLFGLADGFVSHRTEFNFNSPEINAALANAWYNFKFGNDHAPSLQSEIILPATILALIIGVWRHIRLFGASNAASQSSFCGLIMESALLITLILLLVLLYYGAPQLPVIVLGCLVVAVTILLVVAALVLARKNSIHTHRGEFQQLIIFLLWCLTVAMFLSLWLAFWLVLWDQAHKFFPHIPYINLSRLHYMHPILWAMVLAASLAVIVKLGRFIGWVTLIITMILHTLTLFNASEDRHSISQGNPSFREFYSPELFNNLKGSLGVGEEISAIASVGLHPSIASYNGIRTLDGYLANYPLNYKNSFRNLIAGELIANPNYQVYFDDWGSRFYIFSHNLASADNFAFLVTKKLALEKNIKINNLNINTEAFVAMGGSHILSAVAIGNSQELGLQLVSIVEDPSSPWQLYFYRVVGVVGHRPLIKQ